MPHGRQDYRKKKKGSCKDFLLGSWWVLLFAFASLAAYHQGTRWLDCECERLVDRRVALLAQIDDLTQKQDDLLLQIQSESDPIWLEIMLMKGLGLVPKGYQKVYFKPEDRS